MLNYLSTISWRRMGESMCRSTFSWSCHKPEVSSCRFTTGGRSPGTHWIGGWLGPRAGLDDVEKRTFLALPGLEFRPLGRAARSQSLYRLRSPSSFQLMFRETIMIHSEIYAKPINTLREQNAVFKYWSMVHTVNTDRRDLEVML
jgi:hypothetical protein